jgi:Leucine-rich repeat (LRR) protein
MYHFASTGLPLFRTPWAAHAGRKLVSSNESETEAPYLSDITQKRGERLLLVVPLWCLYKGVTCGVNPLSPSFNRVLDINIRNLGLTGYIPTSIASFNLLTSFDVGQNAIRETIPSSIVTLTALQKLSLDYNVLTGTIPSRMFQLTSLTSLSLNSNYLTMGSASTVEISTFATATRGGLVNLTANCLAYQSTVTATHCRQKPTSRKSCLTSIFLILGSVRNSLNHQRLIEMCIFSLTPQITSTLL